MGLASMEGIHAFQPTVHQALPLKHVDQSSVLIINGHMYMQATQHIYIYINIYKSTIS